jgi:hypothetical protein
VKKKNLLLLLPIAAAAVPVVKFIKKMPKERNKILEKKYVNTLSRLHKNIPDIEGSLKKEAFQNENGEFLSEPLKNAHFSLGYSKISILPDDILKKPYYIGGTVMLPLNVAEDVEDDLFVRTVSIDDNSGRGKVVFAAVDCIGLSNMNVRLVREKLKDFAKENNISHINIASTHTHSAIDTMGIWGPIFTVYKNNKAVRNGKKEGKLLNSVNEEYMEFLLDIIAASVKNAVLDMSKGKLYTAQMGSNSKEQTGENDSIEKAGLFDYLWDRRPPKDNSSLLTRIRFVPDDESKSETIIASCAAHPYINSLPIRGKNTGRTISGDFVYYMGETMEKAGYNFLFLNGAVEGVYPSRLYSDRLRNIEQAKAVGTELSMITLAMTKTTEEIENSEILNPDIYEKSMGIFKDGEKSKYALWLEKKGDTVIPEKEAEPLINIRISKAELKVDNPIYILIGKLEIGNFGVLKNFDGSYSSVTEVGYMELGKDLKFAMIPGEMDPSITSGTLVMKGENVFTGEDFPLPSLEEIAGTDKLCVIGLCNDAIGYIIPDNDFLMVFFGSSKFAYKLFGSHYHEIFSFGRKTASTLVKAFMEAVGLRGF